MDGEIDFVKLIIIGIMAWIGLVILQNMYTVSVEDFHLITTTASNTVKIMG